MLVSIVSLGHIVEVPGEEGIEKGVDDDHNWTLSTCKLWAEDADEGEGIEDNCKDKYNFHPLYHVRRILNAVIF